jgi:hypothetical protein
MTENVMHVVFSAVNIYESFISNNLKSYSSMAYLRYCLSSYINIWLLHSSPGLFNLTQIFKEHSLVKIDFLFHNDPNVTSCRAKHNVYS